MEGTDKLATALAKAQAKMTAPTKNKEVSGRSYKFRYATLDKIIDSIRPHLTENGLWFTQTMCIADGRWQLQTTLMHSSGQSITGVNPLILPDKADNQSFGSALTYMRRYALTTMLGIAADEDDDAGAADTNNASTRSPASNGKTDTFMAAKTAIMKTTDVGELNKYLDHVKKRGLPVEQVTELTELIGKQMEKGFTGVEV